MRIFMLPSQPDLGIGRVVESYRLHLPKFGFEFVSDESKADIVVVHAGCQSTRQPDVLHCHGLYPTATLDTSDQFFVDNSHVIHNIRRARTITVPSEWVAQSFRRDMLFDPVVLPHGIDFEEWDTIYNGNHNGYGLWAKGHLPGVCDPSPLNDLARAMPKQKFVTTFGDKADNVTITGRVPFEKMKEYIPSAGFYVATTKETFGIQTLEAMACGVPVVGYDHGATPDIVDHGITGWLVDPDDIDGLKRGVEWVLDHRKSLSRNCRETARQYDWSDVVWELSTIYDNVLSHDNSRPDVSVVISCRNYARHVGQAIESVLNQDFSGDIELIVVNDGSTDESAKVISSYVDKGVTLVDQPNAGVAMARNNGIRLASSDIIANLDADDIMLPNFLKDLVPTVVDNRNVGVSFGKLIMRMDGIKKRVGDWPWGFDFTKQANRENCVPSACVFRKEAWKRVGGYRKEYTPAEDAEFWLRIASVGYDVVMATKEPVYEYNAHAGSLSRTLTEPDWVSDKPWSINPDLTPFAAPANGHNKASYPFRNYDDPWVSVIIPVGPGHESIVHRAVDSVWRQVLPYWECIVVNDSGSDLYVPATGRSLESAYPFITLLDTGGGKGAAHARNLGAVQAKSDLFVFVDADDWLLPEYLSETVGTYNDNPDCYVYTDWLSEDGNTHTASEFDCDKVLKEALHPITALIPAAWHFEVGGFDEELQGWEDWDYTLKHAKIGHCGVRLPMKLMVYDYTTGMRREDSYNMRSELLHIIRGRYRREEMACKGCGGKRNTGVRTPRASRSAPNRKPVTLGGNNMSEDGKVLVRENSNNRGTHSVVGTQTRIKYGRRKHGDVFPMHVDDQRAQPQLYILVTVDPPKADIPARPSAPRVVRPPVEPLPPVVEEEPVTTQVPVEAVAVLEEPIDNIVGEFLGEEEIVDEVDISLMSLNQIKAMAELDEFDDEDVLALFEEEQIGRNRKTVLSYLEGLVEFVPSEE